MFNVFVGGIHMEANSFNPVFATKETFTTILEGDQLEAMKGTSLELGGIYSFMDTAQDIQIIPGFFAQACTSGPVKGSDFDYLCEKLFQSLQQAGQVDGVLMVLHGAMQSEHISDCEGYIIKKVRDIVGRNIPICTSLDLHALITKEMIENLDGAAGYFTYPHVDHFDTGQRAAQSLAHLLRTGIKPYRICRHIPMIMSCENSNTLDSPMVFAINKLKELLGQQGVLSGSVFLTQPWLDAPDLGCSICIFAEDEEKRGCIMECIDAILFYIWESRELFYPPMPDIKQALSRIDQMKKPAFLVDYGDVPNAGGTGDGTVILNALMDAKLSDTSLVVVADAESTNLAVETGIGNTAQFHIGGCERPGTFNERIAITATVLSLNPRPFVHLGPAQKGFISSPGMRALLRAGNVYIILCQQVCFSHDRNMLLSMGLELADIDIIAMRATHSFMSCYEGMIGSWLYVDTPGYSTRNLKSLPFRHCRRPVYPLDSFDQFIINEVI